MPEQIKKHTTHPRIAYICKSGQALHQLEKDGLPDGVEGFPVHTSSCGVRFDHMEILFKPTEEREIEALKEWFCCLKPTRANMGFIDNFYREHD
jgi:hypothetical protein